MGPVIAAVLLLTSFQGLILRAQVFDGGGLLGGLGRAKSELGGSGIRLDSNILIVIVRVLNAALTFLAVAAVVAFTVSGFMFILGFGSDTAIQRAKKIMTWSAVGILVTLLSYILTAFIIGIALA